tara:strand:+ start:5348 stop:6181 length:834 start_codon:yes stop_codon:yes gene_type:complete
MNKIIYDIDTLFPVHTDCVTEYQDKLQTGLKYAENKKIAILCLARNIANQFKFPMRQIRLLLENFHKESNVYVYENDSNDDTPALIQELFNKPEYSNFSIVSEKLDTKYLPLSRNTVRTFNMARARIACYNSIDKQLLNSYDFFVVLDIDFLNFSTNGLFNSLGWMKDNPEISAMCGNSYIKNQSNNQYTNYDSFAFRLNHWNEQNIPWFPEFYLPIGSKPFEVFSGFGGCCIYRKEFYKPLYSGEDCEHVMLHKNLTNKFQNFKLFYNPSQIMMVQ